MKIPDICEPKLLFSVDAVEKQLERIFHDPHFTESVILKKFLSFIVQETILGRANQLKEYTIAIGVLDKPHYFNPQENGIVRIHAGRLRHALHKYYEELGRDDQIIITIPKGKYVPVFTNRVQVRAMKIVNHGSNDSGYETTERGDLILAVLPFTSATKNVSAKLFADGLCLQISSMLTRVSSVSVIAYQVIKNLVGQYPDCREMGAAFGFNHIITGGVQYLKDKLRVTVQLIECVSCRQAWSETFEKQISKSNFFEIEDDIVRRIFDQLEEFVHNKELASHSPLPVAL